MTKFSLEQHKLTVEEVHHNLPLTCLYDSSFEGYK
jgi:hypothetical protein